MHVVWYSDKNSLCVYGDHDDKRKEYLADCEVRNELNGERKLHEKSEVVYTIPGDRYEKAHPYMPRVFPSGSWKIIGIEYTEQNYLRPVKVITNAEQLVPIWELDPDGGYRKVTKKTAMDSGYLIHYWEGRTTLGCIRMNSFVDMMNFAEVISPYLGVFKEITFEVL